jgi:hypothetical protein
MFASSLIRRSAVIQTAVLLGAVFAPVLIGHSANATPSSDNDYAYFDNQGLAFGQQSVMKYATTAASSDFTFARNTPFTLEAMVKPRSLISDREANVFDFRTGPGHDAQARFVVKSADGGNTGSVALWNPPRGDVASSAGVYNFNQWNHIAAVYDGNDGVKLYVNGVLNGSSSSWYPDTKTNVRLYLGFDSDRYYDGWMNEVRVWNGVARTQSQILANMGNEINPTSTGLVAYYRMDDRSGSSFSDETGRGNIATFTNAITFVTGANGVANSEVPTTTTTTIATTTTSTTTTTTTTTVVTAPQSTVPALTNTGGQAAQPTIAPAAKTSVTTVAKTASTVAASVAPTTTTTVPMSTTTVVPPAPSVQAVAPGEAAITIGGEAASVAIKRENNQVTLAVGDLSATLGSVDSNGDVTALDADGNVRLNSGDVVRVALAGFQANSDVEAWLFSTPQLMGTAKVGADGVVVGNFNVPKDVSTGSHRIALVAKAANGKPVTLAIGVKVGEWKKERSITIWLIVLPIVLAIVGALLVPATRRRAKKTA